MANIVVSNICNLNCAYCFADSHMRQSRDLEIKPFIQMETFERHLDILDKLNVSQIRLIGGEPTLHPQFPMLVETALKRGKPVLIFSNGLMPTKVVDTLEKTDPKTCTVLVNMSTAHGVQGLNQEHLERRSWVIQQLGARILLGFNISDPIFTLDDLFEVIRNSDCQRSVRVGLAQPVLNGNNHYLRPKYYPKVGRSIADSAIRGFELGIALEFDCGFVRCMFSDEEIKILEKTGADYGWRCNPVLDIDISGKVFHCYPLAKQFSTNLSTVSDPGKLRAQFIKETGIFQATGIYPEFSICPYRQNGKCMGGCLANVIKRFRHNNFRLKVASDKLRRIDDKEQ